jgi:hypothetical protein
LLTAPYSAEPVGARPGIGDEGGRNVHFAFSAGRGRLTCILGRRADWRVAAQPRRARGRLAPGCADQPEFAASGKLPGLLVLLRWLLAVVGLWRLLRLAGHGLRVLLAGLRSLLVGLVGLILRGFAHGDPLGFEHRTFPARAWRTTVVWLASAELPEALSASGTTDQGRGESLLSASSTSARAEALAAAFSRWISR